MNITGAIVLFAVTWFMVFFIILPLRFVSQADTGHVVPGTPSSAPAQEVVKRKAWLTTWVTLAVWLLLVAVIASEVITVRDIDFMNRLDPLPIPGGTGG